MFPSLFLILAACTVADSSKDPSGLSGDTTESPPDTSLPGDTSDPDGDGWTVSDGDCDGQDPAVHPGAVEICDPKHRDEDCDGLADYLDPSAEGQTLWYRDEDQDGWGDPALFVRACDATDGYVAAGTDCDDRQAATHPGAEDPLCDGVDQDCDGLGASTIAILEGVQYDELQEALTAASDGSEVLVCPGTWIVNGLLLSSESAPAITLASWSGNADDTILDGDLWDTILEVQGSILLEVRDLTFQRGTLGRISEKGMAGGAIFAMEASLSLKGCVFRDNTILSVYGSGAAVATLSYLPTYQGLSIRDCVFSGNRADHGSDLVSAHASLDWDVVSIADSVFEDGSIIVSGGLIEAGTWLSSGMSFSITGSTITANDSEDSASCIDINSDRALYFLADGNTFTDNVFGENVLNLNSSEGDTTATFRDNVFADNIGYHGQAPLKISSQYADIDASFDGDILDSNVVPNSVGALWFNAGNRASVALTDTSFLSNVSYHGALYFSESEIVLDMVRTTFSGNLGSGIASALSVGNYSDTTFTIEDSSFTDNMNGRGAIYVTGGTVSGSIRDSIFSGNVGTDVASAMSFASTGIVEIIDTIVDKNTMAGSGAAIRALAVAGSLDVTITGGAVTANTAGEGGGVLADGAVIVARDVDMGSDATDNLPSDIFGCDLELGAGASFTVSDDTGTTCVEE